MERKGYVKQRIETLRVAMKASHIEAAVIVKPENVMYYSGFNPIINSHPVFFVISQDQPAFLLVPAIRKAHADMESALEPEHIRVYGHWGNTPSLGMDPLEVIYKLTGRRQTVGVELNYLSVDMYQRMTAHWSGAKFTSITHIIDDQKVIKDAYEISLIRKAAQLVDCGTTTIIEELKAGQSEMAACTEAQYAMRRLWQSQFSEHETCGYGSAEGGIFDSLYAWCLTNERIAYGCDTAKSHVVKSGDVTLPMTWAKLDGYHGENERTVLVGSVSPHIEKAYESMLEARKTVFGLLKPGIPFADLYEAAADVFRTYGFGHILPGRIGHGIGASAHEIFSVNGHNDKKIKPGMVMSIEPGLMDREWGGVRHSDTVVITDTGYEILTKSPAGMLRI